MKIILTIPKRKFDPKTKTTEIHGTYTQEFTQELDGRWKTDIGYILECDVIDMVKKYDPKNMYKYFPMANFHN